MNILITGASGFIGRRLLKYLLECEKTIPQNITCLTRNPKSLQDFIGKVTIIAGDICELKTLISALTGIDVVYHLAAKSNPSSIVPYSVYEKINVFGTENLLRAAVHFPNIKKILLVSSIAASGPSLDGKHLNESSLCKPITHYGRSKLEAEHLANNLYKSIGLPITIVRPPMVYGIGDRDWVGLFELIKRGGFPLLGVPLPGNHENLFDFCYVDNLVQGFVQAAVSKKTDGQTYFLSDTRSYQIKEIITAVARAYQVSEPRKFWSINFAQKMAKISGLLEKSFQTDMPFNQRSFNWMTSNYWICDITKAKNDFNYNPMITLQEGVSSTISNLVRK